MLEIRRLATRQADFAERLAELRAYDAALDDNVENTVAEILRQVRSRGDAALLEYTRRFDRLEAPSVESLELPAERRAAALEAIPENLRAHLETAARRITAYHQRQKLESWSQDDGDGVLLGQRVTPLDRVGLYVPGGKAAYPSSVLMNALPAKVAGVGELIMVTPAPDGRINELVLAAAAIAGVDRLFSIGGAQAIAALAYGTATIPRVDKIVGPGSAYVAAAKRQVFGAVGIDMLAGPSEILVICDGQTPAEWVAWDLFSQAEHDEQAQSLLLSPDPRCLDAVAAAMTRCLAATPRQAVIRAALARRGALIEVRDLAEACALANAIAPEHLELSVADPEAWLPHIRHAGAIFLGRYASESLGDYCAGPNHVLPTSGTARFSSPLGVYDFQKRTSLIGISAAAARRLGETAAALADGEGLPAHAASARCRTREAS